MVRGVRGILREKYGGSSTRERETAWDMGKKGQVGSEGGEVAERRRGGGGRGGGRLTGGGQKRG